MNEWVAHPAEEKLMSIPQPEAGTSRNRSWHRLLWTSRDNNWMDKAVMQQVPSIREEKKKNKKCHHFFLLNLCHLGEKVQDTFGQKEKKIGLISLFIMTLA